MYNVLKIVAVEENSFCRPQKNIFEHDIIKLHISLLNWNLQL